MSGPPSPVVDSATAGARHGQTYATHVHRARTWVIAFIVASLALLLLVLSAFGEPTLQSFALVLLGVAVVLGIYITRSFALRLQDRIIRLEMQTRLTRLGRGDELSRLDLRQLIALRFASDAELPPLIARAVAEKLTPDQIKRAITDWQGDYLRT